MRIQVEARGVKVALASCAAGFAGFVFLRVWTSTLPGLFANHTLAAGWALFSILASALLGCIYFGSRVPATASRVRIYYFAVLTLGITGIPVWQLLRVIRKTPDALIGIGISSPPVLSTIVGVLVFCILFVPGFLLGAFLTYGTRRADGAAGRGVAARTLWAFFTGVAAGALILPFVMLPHLSDLVSLGIAAGVPVLAGLAGLVRPARPMPEETGAAQPAPIPTERNASLPDAVFQALFVLGAALWTGSWFRLGLITAGPSIQVLAALSVAVSAGLAAGSAIASHLSPQRISYKVGAGVVASAAGILLLFLDRWAARLPLLFLESIGSPPLVWGSLLKGYFLLAFGTVFCPALLVGMLLVLFAGGRDPVRRGRPAGGFTWIILGLLVSVLATGFLPGKYVSQKDLIAGVPWMCVAAGLFFLATARRGRALRVAWIAAVAAAAVSLAATQPRWTNRLLARGVYILPVEFKQMNDPTSFPADTDFLFFQDDRNVLVSVERSPDAVTLRVNGSIRSSGGSGMVPYLLTGHIPLLLSEDPHSVFVGGLGGGLTLRSVEAYPVDEIRCAEPSGAVVRAARLFSAYNGDALSDARVTVSVRDVANDLLFSTGRYDAIILAGPLPYSYSSATELAGDFFALVRSRLAPNGIACQRVSTFGFSPPALKSLAKTFASYFPHVGVWWVGADEILLMGSNRPLRFDEDRIAGKMSSTQVEAELKRLDMSDPDGILSCFLMGREELTGFCGDADPFIPGSTRLALSWPQRPLDLVKSDCLADLVSNVENSIVLLQPVEPGSVDYKIKRDRLDRCSRALDYGARSLASVRESRIRQAVGLLTQARELCPFNGIYTHTLADYFIILSRSLQSAGRTEEAVEGARRAVELLPESPRTYYNLASIEVTRDPGTAIALLGRAVQLNPYYVPAYLLKARAELTSGRAKEASETVGQVLTMEPFNAEAHRLRGLSFIDRGMYSEGRAELEVVLQAQPDNVDALDALAYVRLLGGDLEEAAAVYRRVLELDPDNLGALNNYATILAELGRYEDAVRIWTRALEISPGNRDIMDNITDARKQMRK